MCVFFVLRKKWHQWRAHSFNTTTCQLNRRIASGIASGSECAAYVSTRVSCVSLFGTHSSLWLPMMWMMLLRRAARLVLAATVRHQRLHTRSQSEPCFSRSNTNTVGGGRKPGRDEQRTPPSLRLLTSWFLWSPSGRQRRSASCLESTPTSQTMMMKSHSDEEVDRCAPDGKMG